MKGSTLHRSGLTREKMSVLAAFSQGSKKQNAKNQINQYYKNTKNQEIDLLWGNVQKGIQKVHNVTKTAQRKSPLMYLTIGFVAGVVFMSCITLLISVSAMTPRTQSAPAVQDKNEVTVIGEETTEPAAQTPEVTQEKYVIKSGDNLSAIAYRFYGKYDEAKIQEIQRINNIKNPAGLQIGQELIIPVSQER